jgi:hypothetical protein
MSDPWTVYTFVNTTTWGEYIALRFNGEDVATWETSNAEQARQHKRQAEVLANTLNKNNVAPRPLGVEL